MDIANIEDKRWENRDLWVHRWHHIALDMVVKEPILDLGGGDGTFATFLRQRGYKKITVTDVSPIAVEKAREKGFGAFTLDANGVPLPFESKSFGTVTLIEVLEHLYDPLSVLKECNRISDDVVISVPNFNYIKDRFKMLTGDIPTFLKPKNRHMYWFNQKILFKMLDEAELEIEKNVCITPLRILPVQIWSLLARIMPNLIAAGYVVKCRSKNKKI